ncbi:MAG TPA: double-strand break repair helicase AddA [Stellaceae bacterium]|jgi:ATP-dependent helicase/nuclease subunit A|nr:double-strand break repair helicase AddA [Stellaceae bacterium]
MSAAVAAATAAQRRALRPGESVWVAASAGTGKTKVLTDRLLALMLDGTDPSHLLCLTFTRAAAAEMANRINQRLAAWTTLPSGKLAEELVALTGQYPQEYHIARARQLFARVLDVPGGAKIATIHAFCQSLLRRFPLEAGVPPEFTVMDERSAEEALAEATEAIILAARADAEPGLAQALGTVARYVADERFTALMSSLAAERGKLRQVLAEGEAVFIRRLCAKLAIPESITVDGVIAAFCVGGDLDGLRAAAAALAVGSAADRNRGLTLARWCASPIDREALLETYIPTFLTTEGEIRDVLITKGAAAKATPADPAGVLQAEAERILRLQADRAAVGLRDTTAALIRLGEALLRAYERRKRLQGLLDYDDLVQKALDLLRQPGVAPWVLFKLDGGLDHILIDEAQDTNPEQWDIVAALAAEFFAGDGASGRVRTVFAVGDAKQSIYSFQRADPGAFAAMRQHFQDRVTAARQPWAIVPLEISFRATAPLLQAVDAVFALADAADGVALDGTPIRHVAARGGHAGLVELWPPVLPEPEEPPDPSDDIAARHRMPEPHTRLARAVAATIADWLARGERLESRGRALRPSDVMVLVRRRNAFVYDLLRALKQRNVPVAGADRLMLTEQLAVQDLIALGHFLLLPEDDLTLATVLKGPLFGVLEDELYRLAYNRGTERLWSRLRRLGADSLTLWGIADRLRHLLARADFVPPFELYAEILGAGGGRRALLERLGPEAADPIDEFLALALAYEREHVPSLQGFLRWLIAGDIEVKRDLGERQRDELRILTVHGAKGLEAPVVFLPDTMQLPDRQAPLLWSQNEVLPLWCPRRELAASAYRDERDALRRRQLQEYRRLLYVALTRAQDRLYVCGWETQRPARESPSWHALCAAGWSGIADRVAFDTRPRIGPRHGWTGEALRLSGPQTVSPSRDATLADARPIGKLPAWVAAPPPAEPNPPKPLLPSRPSGPEPATLSPLAEAGRDRFKRGLLVHRLLQSLPELPPAERGAAARRFLALPAHGLADAAQTEICDETLAVLNEPGFAELWGPDAQAEVPVVGLIGDHALSGQIDRLVVTAERVVIVDYKTIRPSPTTEDDIPVLYVQQLATYRAALGRIYPGRRIECAMLWTDGPRLMPVSPALLDRHLPGHLV